LEPQKNGASTIRVLKTTKKLNSKSNGISKLGEQNNMQNGSANPNEESSKVIGKLELAMVQRRRSESSRNSRVDYFLSFLDKTNKEIIGILETNALQSQTEIASKLGLSQSSIALRLDKLRSSGLLSDVVGVHLKKIGVDVCRADVDCSDARNVLEWSKSCPLFLNGTIGIGGTNLSLYFASEDLEMFQFIIDEHIRRLEGVGAVRFESIVSWARDFVAPLKLDITRSDNPPCGMLPYCPRCPANPAYDGKVWNDYRRR
jgi:DNA-binding Lrp family transcriptional regulator